MSHWQSVTDVYVQIAWVGVLDPTPAAAAAAKSASALRTSVLSFVAALTPHTSQPLPGSPWKSPTQSMKTPGFVALEVVGSPLTRQYASSPFDR
jgi:hypothetical protein